MDLQRMMSLLDFWLGGGRDSRILSSHMGLDKVAELSKYGLSAPESISQ